MLARALLLMISPAFLLLCNSPASAQPICHLGVYFDAEGTQTTTVPIRDLGDPLFEIDLYYVLQVEHLVSGVAWNRQIVPDVGLVAVVQHYDPLEQFLEVTPQGFRMGLGHCVSGFDGPFLVLHETLIFDASLPYLQPGTQIRVAANVLEDPDRVVYTDCTANAEKWFCNSMGSALIIYGMPIRHQSWGAVKALY